MIPSSVISTEDVSSLAVIARSIRASITRARDPDFAEMWITFVSYYMKRTADADGLTWCVPEESEILVNSTYGFDWNLAHFGFPGRARFYTSGVLDRYISVHRANPTKLPDGTWISNEGAVDISFRIRREVAEKVENAVRADFTSDD
ncbi:hypothetical protein BOTBODRAFT_35410 [Botryobasidium botryosum FD-172 SS1]|nr:hypothetical protein BOTBODRAFT_35410 [Botryobasidium botryosum FD-172 SS1]